MNRLLTHVRLTLFGALALGALIMGPGQAHATPEFPRTISDHLMLSQDPPCSVCHAGNVLTNDSVFTPFGQALRLNGLVAEDDPSLIRALDALDRDGIDSDHDGVSDIDELMAGTLPNTPPLEPPPPDWHLGCTVPPAGARSPSSGGLALFVAVGFVLVVRRRPRRRANRL